MNNTIDFAVQREKVFTQDGMYVGNMRLGGPILLSY